MPAKEEIDAAKAASDRLRKQMSAVEKACADGQAKPEDLRARRKMFRRAARRWRALAGKKKRLPKGERAKAKEEKKS